MRRRRRRSFLVWYFCNVSCGTMSLVGHQNAQR